MPATLLLAAIGTAARTETFAIRSFDGDGQLVFSAVGGATNYQVRTAPTPTGTWSVAVGTIAPTADNLVTAMVATAGVTVFYRVLAFTNMPPPPGSLYLVMDLSGGASAPSYPVAYLDAIPSGGWTVEHKTTKMVLRRIPATTGYIMGSPSGELGRSIDETQHTVKLTQDFYIGVFEVTQRQWELVMGNRPSYFNNATYYQTRPVEQVSYYDIRENPANSAISPNWPQSSLVHADSFMGKLRAKTGLGGFDLPTESQWEYACRAGTTTALNSGYNLTSTSNDARMSAVGRYWFNGGSGFSQNCSPNAGTAVVGAYLANAWGLYDMHGNVWEWCLDWYGAYPGTVTDPQGATSGSSRIARGGSWSLYAFFCRSAFRDYLCYPNDRYYDFGFRVCCVFPGQQ